MAVASVPTTRTRDETALGRLAVTARRYGPGVGAWLTRVGNRLLRTFLTLAAIVCAVVGMAMIAVPLGLLTAAAGLLWLEYAITPPAPPDGET